MPRSIYRPLDKARHEVRLLILHPSYKSQRPSFEAPIKCNLKTVAFRYSFSRSGGYFQRPEPYIALSYAWGDPGQTKPITVNGVRMQVTMNLHNALRHIRKRRKRTVLWVDAICINQEDDDEKSFQVGTLMRHIYEQAQGVIAWLGEPTCFDAEILARGVLTASDDDLGNVLKLIGAIIERHDMATGYSWDLECFERMFRMPWWGRVWVVQEVLLAKHLVFKYGRLEMTPSAIVHFFRYCVRVGGRITEQGSSGSPSSNDNLMLVATLNRRDTEKFTNMSLYEYMCFYGSRQASNPRDKIYAFMGVAKDTDDYDPPDYTKRAEDVYINFAMTLALQNGSLDFLDGAGVGHVARSAHPGLTLPSWVPDWTRLTSSRTWMPINDGRKAMGRPPEYRFSDSHEILYAQGVVYDVVSEVVPTPTNKASFPLRWDRFLPQNKPPPYRTGIPALQAYFRAFDFDYDFPEAQPLGDTDSISIFRSFTSFLLAGSRESLEEVEYLSSLTTISEGEETMSEEEETISEEEEKLKKIAVRSMEPFLKFTGDDRRERSDATILGDFFSEVDAHRYLEWLENDDLHTRFLRTTQYLERKAYYFCDRALFWTDQGFIGHGFAEVRAGDMVCCLLGYHCPIILRPEGAYYIVVGHCFVLGLMDSEVINKLEQSEIHLREISIK
ncbi:heterokaryon incompatibility protein-domain-containing protein [Hypomontagnella monticulosa]|nr:heterokaryon incompatibility protein-domain-containing protein [Hypomontagnella monticulosa]